MVSLHDFFRAHFLPPGYKEYPDPQFELRILREHWNGEPRDLLDRSFVEGRDTPTGIDVPLARQQEWLSLLQRVTLSHNSKCPLPSRYPPLCPT